MKGKKILALILCTAIVFTSSISSRIVTYASTSTSTSAPEGWRNLQDISVFKDTYNGWSQSGDGELEAINGSLPVDSQETYENLPSLRFNVSKPFTSWMTSVITLAGWANHDVSQYVPDGYLEFNVKGKSGGEQFKIGAVDHVARRESGVEHTITKTITATNEWQHVKIPLKDILDPSLGMDAYNTKAIVLDKVTNDPFCVWLNQIKLTSPDKEKAYPAIKLNQVGFLNSSEKYAYVSGFEDEFKATEGTQFQVKRVSDDSVAYTGELVLDKAYDAESGERVLKAVFTDLKDSGDYYITVNADGIDKSLKFKIGNDIFKPLLADAARYYYYQRSGIDLTAPYCTDFPRKDYTPQDTAAVFESDPTKTKDVSKGWFDAGDKGKWMVDGAAAVTNLLWSYEMFPESYSDKQFNIPESGNGVPDVLDEARWELEWILKMQDTDGGIYGRVNSSPNDGQIEKRVINDTFNGVANVKPTNDTAAAAAALAHASIVYRTYDPAFADKCLNAAKSAWDYLEHNPNNVKGPGYTADKDNDSRLEAAASLYRATGESKYNDYFVANYTQGKKEYENTTGDWVGTWNFAFFYYMKANNRNSDAVKWFNDEFTIWVNDRTNRSKSNAWGNTISDGNYYWGSNNIVLGTCTEALIGSKLLGTYNDAIKNMAMSSLNYILGANAMRKSFVTGYGDDSIKTVYSLLDKDPRPGVIKGVMPLGVNRWNGGGSSNFPAKDYLDSSDEWTTNEHSVGSACNLVFITAFANSNQATPATTSTAAGN
ncbi:glycoside hydrolase family 9 protein [Clostridium sp.]|uniref:glycoside hydrolase family 9 protein n=1 Tax=Clostridium sp. TaxID=1506 RepID=UPI002840C18E|nr:glycoside hydrolase family 9 protein [Clostridium sp.]MDR3593735.1 glycoside hydrolase family 9 protein [Clostridium sp.]